MVVYFTRESWFCQGAQNLFNSSSINFTPPCMAEIQDTSKLAREWLWHCIGKAWKEMYRGMWLIVRYVKEWSMKQFLQDSFNHYRFQLKHRKIINGFHNGVTQGKRDQHHLNSNWLAIKVWAFHDYATPVYSQGGGGCVCQRDSQISRFSSYYCDR